jgi:hypothetical protein
MNASLKEDFFEYGKRRNPNRQGYGGTDVSFWAAGGEAKGSMEALGVSPYLVADKET